MLNIHDILGKAPAMNKFAPIPNKGTNGTNGHLKVSGGFEWGSSDSTIQHVTDRVPKATIMNEGHESRTPTESKTVEKAKQITSTMGFDPLSRTDLL
jgi:hypothetical protein